LVELKVAKPSYFIVLGFLLFINSSKKNALSFEGYFSFPNLNSENSTRKRRK
jgi:hypothetical protein